MQNTCLFLHLDARMVCETCWLSHRKETKKVQSDVVLSLTMSQASHLQHHIMTQQSLFNSSICSYFNTHVLSLFFCLFSITILHCSFYLFIVSHSLNETSSPNPVLSHVLTSCALLSCFLKICSHCWPCDSLSRKPKPCSQNSKLLNGLNARIYPFRWHAFW